MTRDAAWLASGGDASRLGLYRMLGTVDTVTDGHGGRALVFLDACGTTGVGAVGDVVPGRGSPAGLLWVAERRLREAGMREAVGPLDGNTFFAYRACVGSVSPEPAFASEPSVSPDAFRALGWREEARYRTTRCPNAPQISRGRPLPAGWRVRALDASMIADELASLYRVTCAAFADAHRYSPIPFDVFARLYAPSRAGIDTRFVLLAEDPQGVVQGYVFAWPEPEHGRFVLKTLAVHPEARGARVATHLMARIHAHAESSGLSYGLHALMWEGSLSGVITAHGGQTVRQYSLYRKRLA